MYSVISCRVVDILKAFQVLNNENVNVNLMMCFCWGLTAVVWMPLFAVLYQGGLVVVSMVIPDLTLTKSGICEANFASLWQRQQT